MKIALMNEFSQAAKNPVILQQLNDVASEQGHDVFNVGMDGDNDHRLTYIHLGICASLLLNAKAVDFVVAGCGTGQGAMMSLNAHPGVFCGYCIEPTDAYLFAQVNNGNALSLAFAKGYGWGAANVSKKEDLTAALQTMINYKGPYVLNVQVPYQEHVLPMIPAGKTVDDIITE